MRINFKFFIFLFFVCLCGFFSCSVVGEIKNRDLYSLTDKYVESLYTEYESYGLLGGEPELTPDGKYQVLPIGRLVNVKIMSVVDDSVYENLCKELSAHYKNDNHVNNVFINQAGTIMIDCRNKK